MNSDKRTRYLNWGKSEYGIGILILLAIDANFLVFNFKLHFLISKFLSDFILLLFLIIILLNKSSWLQRLGFSRFKKEIVAEGVALLLVCYFLLYGIKVIFKILTIDLPTVHPKYLYAGNPELLIFFSFVLIGPIVEEIYMRGFIFNGLLNEMNWMKAAVISSSIFALVHVSPGNIYRFIPAFIFGMAFCYLFNKSRSVIPGIIIHSFHNLFIFLITYKQYLSTL